MPITEKEIKITLCNYVIRIEVNVYWICFVICECVFSLYHTYIRFEAHRVWDSWLRMVESSVTLRVASVARLTAITNQITNSTAFNRQWTALIFC